MTVEAFAALFLSFCFLVSGIYKGFGRKALGIAGMFGIRVVKHTSISIGISFLINRIRNK